MSPRNATPLPDEVVRELEAIDAALAGRPVDPELAELADLAIAVRDERPRPAPAFAAQLDASAADRFRARERGTAGGRPRPWLPAVGAVASVAAATVIALSVIGIDDDSVPGGGIGRAPLRRRSCRDRPATTRLPRPRRARCSATRRRPRPTARGPAPPAPPGCRQGAEHVLGARRAHRSPTRSRRRPRRRGAPGGVTRSVERGAQLRSCDDAQASRRGCERRRARHRRRRRIRPQLGRR